MKQTSLFEQIHRGFRAWLFELGIELQQTDFSRTAEGKETVREISAFLSQIERYYFLETRYFFPLLALKAPYAVYLLQEEQIALQKHCRHSSRLIIDYSQPGTAIHLMRLGLAIQESFHELMASLLRYFNHQDALYRESGIFLEGGLSGPDNQGRFCAPESLAAASAIFFRLGMRSADGVRLMQAADPSSAFRPKFRPDKGSIFEVVSMPGTKSSKALTALRRVA